MGVVLVLVVLTVWALAVKGNTTPSRSDEKRILTGTTLLVPPTRVDNPRCQEDDPCFDCKTMGNRICGVKP